MIFPQFGDNFITLIKNYYSEGHPIIYLLKQKDKWDYNPICMMSSGLMFDDIIMNMIRNKVLEYHVAVVDSYLTKMENTIIYMCME